MWHRKGRDSAELVAEGTKGMEEFFWQDKMVSKAEQRWELDKERKKKEKSYLYESPNCRIAVILYQIASFSFSSLRNVDYLKYWD